MDDDDDCANGWGGRVGGVHDVRCSLFRNMLLACENDDDDDDDDCANGWSGGRGVGVNDVRCSFFRNMMMMRVVLL